MGLDQPLHKQLLNCFRHIRAQVNLLCSQLAIPVSAQVLILHKLHAPLVAVLQGYMSYC